MFNEKRIYEILDNWVDFPQTLMTQIEQDIVYAGKTVYVVSQYYKSRPFEVIECIVTAEKYNPRKDRYYFVAEGRWSNDIYYNGSFKESSINTSVFFNKSKAVQVMEEKNRKLEAK